MPLDAAGEVIVGAVEVVGDVLADLGADAAVEAWANGDGEGGGAACGCF